MLSRFIWYRNVTDGQTDGQTDRETDRFAISISRVSMLTRDKNAYGQLILRKISKIGATRCQILRLKCTKFDFRWGSACPRSRWGSSQCSPRPLTVFKGPTSKGREGKGERRWRKGGGEVKGRGLEGPPVSCWHRAPRRVNPALHKFATKSTSNFRKVVCRILKMWSITWVLFDF